MMKKTKSYSKVILPIVIGIILTLVVMLSYKKVMYPVFYSATQNLIDAKFGNLESTQYFEHTDTNEYGCDFACRVNKVFPSFLGHDVSENLYHGPCNKDNAYVQWEHSPKHKENLDKIPSSDFNIFRMEKDGSSDGRNWCYAILEVVKY